MILWWWSSQWSEAEMCFMRRDGCRPTKWHLDVVPVQSKTCSYKNKTCVCSLVCGVLISSNNSCKIRFHDQLWVCLYSFSGPSIPLTRWSTDSRRADVSVRFLQATEQEMDFERRDDVYNLARLKHTEDTRYWLRAHLRVLDVNVPIQVELNIRPAVATTCVEETLCRSWQDRSRTLLLGVKTFWIKYTASGQNLQNKRISCHMGLF